MSIFRKDPNKPDPAAATPDAARTAVAAPSSEGPAAQRARDARRQPKAETRAFKVHTRGIERKRRAGVEFTTEPQIVNAEDLTEDQAIELLNTPHLYVEELTSTSKDAVKPADVASQPGPAPDSLRAAGDAPVPTPTDSPGPRPTGPAPQVIGGMAAVENTPQREGARAPRGEPKPGGESK